MLTQGQAHPWYVHAWFSSAQSSARALLLTVELADVCALAEKRAFASQGWLMLPPACSPKHTVPYNVAPRQVGKQRAAAMEVGHLAIFHGPRMHAHTRSCFCTSKCTHQQQRPLAWHRRCEQGAGFTDILKGSSRWMCKLHVALKSTTSSFQDAQQVTFPGPCPSGSGQAGAVFLATAGW